MNKILSQETKEKISKNHYDVSGVNNPFCGKRHSQETIQKILNNDNYKETRCYGEESHFAKLTLEQATYIKKYLKNHNTTCKEENELAQQFGVTINTIQKIKHNRTWKHVIV